MNARARQLADTLLGTLDGLDGASALSVRVYEAWRLILIIASSDEAVIALGAELELAAAEIAIGEKQWWWRASAEDELRALRIVVAGPHHLGPPPEGDAGDASS